MDGLEWKRTKYSKWVQRFLMFAEKLAVKSSHLLVADSTYIQSYIHQKYTVLPHFIAYGAVLFNDPDRSYLDSFNVQAYSYNMIVARMEPENNIEMILDGIHLSESEIPFFVVGNSQNKFGAYLKEKFKNDKRIVFVGPIYDSTVLNNLRHFSAVYFHGHSVGGTNPSLLEAMGCKCFVVAHDNEFNRSVLGNDSFYFSRADEIGLILNSCQRLSHETLSMIDNNFIKIRERYSWEKIIDQYEQLMLDAKSLQQKS